jgi:hypothetical protein
MVKLKKQGTKYWLSELKKRGKMQRGGRGYKRATWESLRNWKCSMIINIHNQVLTLNYSFAINYHWGNTGKRTRNLCYFLKLPMIVSK